MYEQRPIQDNEGGASSVGTFSLWYFLQRLQPNLVIESGVWKGQTTWIIEQTIPHAKIICLDPKPEYRIYTSPNATYPKEDFQSLKLNDVDPEKSVVFFDDHQDAVARTIQARRKGFKHLIFDDNYAVGCGSHRSLQHGFAESGNVADYLNRVIETYQIFPPMFPYDQPITGELVTINLPAIGIDESPEWQIFKDEMASYRWMTYVCLKDNVDLPLKLKVIERMNSSL